MYSICFLITGLWIPYQMEIIQKACKLWSG